MQQQSTHHPIKHHLHAIWEYISLYLGLGVLGVVCLLWLPVATVLNIILPARTGGIMGRYVISFVFRLYLRILTLLGACQFDFGGLESLKNQSPMIIAPNHPCLLDAVIVISRLPNMLCIMKAALLDNIFLGTGARLAQYIRNDSAIKMIRDAVKSLKNDSHLLIFPEGTRTTRLPVNPFTGGLAIIACKAQVPIQVVFIETDSAYLSKGWPLFRKPSMPISYRVRLGRRFEPTTSARSLMKDLERYFTTELSLNPPMPDPATSVSATVHS